jgi:hypothetical protein
MTMYITQLIKSLENATLQVVFREAVKAAELFCQSRVGSAPKSFQFSSGIDDAMYPDGKSFTECLVLGNRRSFTFIDSEEIHWLAELSAAQASDDICGYARIGLSIESFTQNKRIQSSLLVAANDMLDSGVIDLFKSPEKIRGRYGSIVRHLKTEASELGIKGFKITNGTRAQLSDIVEIPHKYVTRIMK